MLSPLTSVALVAAPKWGGSLATCLGVNVDRRTTIRAAPELLARAAGEVGRLAVSEATAAVRRAGLVAEH